MDKPLKIQITGPSGIGKTTVAKQIADVLDIPFISGSYSDIVADTEKESHVSMIDKPYNLILSQDYQLLSKRAKIFSKTDTYVSDRSTLDVLVYHLVKLTKYLPTCETEAVADSVKTTLKPEFLTHLIFIAYPNDLSWDIQNNSKRIQNRYFQFSVSELFKSTLNNILGIEFKKPLFKNDKYLLGKLGSIKILVLLETDKSKRLNIIRKFLK